MQEIVTDLSDQLRPISSHAKLDDLAGILTAVDGVYPERSRTCSGRRLFCIDLLSAMLTRKSLKIFPDNHQVTVLSSLVVARCVNSMVAIIWAPFGLSLIGSGRRPGCVNLRPSAVSKFKQAEFIDSWLNSC